MLLFPFSCPPPRLQVSRAYYFSAAVVAGQAASQGRADVAVVSVSGAEGVLNAPSPLPAFTMAAYRCMKGGGGRGELLRMCL